MPSPVLRSEINYHLNRKRLDRGLADHSFLDANGPPGSCPTLTDEIRPRRKCGSVARASDRLAGPLEIGNVAQNDEEARRS